MNITQTQKQCREKMRGKGSLYCDVRGKEKRPWSLTLESPGIIKNSAQAGLLSISSSAFVPQEETKQCTSNITEHKHHRESEKSPEQEL